MTDGTAGWFRDPNDPALARWHDGDRWTEHTLVIADQTPGTEPPPPVTAPTVATPLIDDSSPYAGWEDAEVDDRPRRPGGVPAWVKVAAPLAAIAVAAAAFLFLSSGDDDPDGDTQTETADSVATLDDAVDAARRAGLPTEITDARAAALIERICDAATDPSLVDELGEQMGRLPAASATDLRQSIAALGIGAELRCEDDLDDEPDLIEDLQNAAVVAFSTTTTAPTVGVDGGTDAGTDAGAATGGGSGGSTTGGSGSGGTTKTTRRSGAATTTPTTARPPTTTTLPTVKAGQPCSPEGARAKNQVAGGDLVCRPKCYVGSGQLIWQRPGSCPTQPSIDPNTPIPSTTTSSIP